MYIDGIISLPYLIIIFLKGGSFMSRMKKYIAITLAFVMSFVLLVPAKQVSAASKKTIYVVDSIKVKGVDRAGEKVNYTQKIKYNKKGFITKINQPDSQTIVYTFSYNKKNQLTKFVINVTGGDYPGKSTYKYTYKNGLVKTRKQDSGDSDKETSTYTYKNKKLVSEKKKSSWKNESGETETETLKYKYTLKNGHITKWTDEYSNTMKTTFDKKGNITKRVFSNKDGDVISDVLFKATLTYNKSGRMTKRVAQYKNPMMSAKEKVTETIKYKKIKVSKSYADAIEAQQWQLLNGEGADHFATDGCEAW